MNKVFKLIIFLVFSNSILFGQSQTTIAVLDLEALGIDPAETSVLSNRLRTLLVNMTDYEVVERSRMEEILKEQGLQQTGCTSDECVVEVGKLLGVQKMLAGSFGKFGNVYTLELRIIDVQTGKIESSTNYDYRSEIENLLLEGVETALRKLLINPAESNFVKKNTGSMQIITHPPGARVSIDYKEYGVTPVFINSLNSGYHEISIEKEGFTTQKEKVVIEPDSINQFNINLRSKFAFLEIKSLTKDAELFINYQSVGKNLFRGERLEPGTYYIELKHDFYNTYTEELTLNAGDSIFRKVELTQAIGELLLDVKPKHVSLVLQIGNNKQNFIISQSESLPVQAGYYNMELKAPSYYPYNDYIKIIGNEKTPLEINLRYGGDDLKKLQNQRKWLNVSSSVGLLLAAGSLLLANQMYTNYEKAKSSSDAESYKSKTQTFTYASYGFSGVTFAVSLTAIWKWYKINQLKNKLDLK